ncbi:hypothetical protein AAF712_015002 [Marasmius tenuissimus]|uniref:SWIM-type domain-containing protein n=1 Tax=Marasmius tenuissimus TaxID=585030 RepID=A0ABR2ZBK7_9AGAR
MSNDLWDNVLRNIDEYNPARDRSVWDCMEEDQDSTYGNNTGQGVWDRWSQSAENDDLSWVRESPSKKRKARTNRERNQDAARSQKSKRQQLEDTNSTLVLSNAIDFPDYVLPSTTMDEMESCHLDDQAGCSADELETYISYFTTENAGFIPIGTYLYAVQGWNKRKSEPNNKWYHFEGRRLGDDIQLTCKCPDGANSGQCVHIATYLEFRDEEFRELEEKMFRDGQVVWFWRELESTDEHGGRIWLNRFSVAIGQQEKIRVNGRTMVSFFGSDTGVGLWNCIECSGINSCPHQKAARQFLRQVMGIDGPEGGEIDESETLESDENIVIFDDTSRPCHQEQVSISHRAIRPPLWAELPWDLIHYARPPPGYNPPQRLSLNEISRTLCGSMVTTIDCEKIINTCTVYTMTGALTREIELVQCPTCPSRKRCFAGPDPRELGLFNYDNTSIFTHELLDEYTSRFTSCETPFVAFVETIARLYDGRGSVFVKEDLFRSVWFAYVSIQDYSQDMRCKKCGEEPECLIWDGVSLGFGRKHIQDSLRPPTHTDSSSPPHNRTYPQKPQAIPQDSKHPIRSLIRRWVAGTRKTRKDEHSDGSGDEMDRGRAVVQDFDVIRQRLMVVSREVGVLFERTLSLHTNIDAALQRCYGNFFSQVAAEESVLQMLHPKSLPILERFLSAPSWQMASKLADIPVLYNVLEAEFRRNGQYPKDLLDACQWLYSRAKVVLDGLYRSDIEGLDTNKSYEAPFNDDWKLTGCCYSLPQIRPRPKYPKLKGDGGTDNSTTAERGGKCAKYYSTYSKQRLTGGIMAVWCTHSVCYGFHCIAKAEGRNDVFSAMYTRWPKAPDRVVYDFACALGPYCMTREPKFFSETQFLIDKFHAPGHTKYNVNSSAAECGNSGISRIRKSVSYMRQNRAILYTKTFLSVWNRGQIRRGMEKK